MKSVADLVLRGGHVLDPVTGVDADLDVVVRDGRIAELRPPSGEPVAGAEVRDVSGATIAPGFIDLHGHWYEGSAYGIDPAVCLRSGVTTTADAGTAGFVNFASFRRQSIDDARLRVLAFVNVAALGIPTTLTGELDTPLHVRPQETADAILANRDVAVGVKVRLSAAVETGTAPAALDAALAAARAAGVPLMVDVGGPGDFMPEALDHLGPGDILTHCFTGGGATIVDQAGRVRPEARRARERGVRFDIGHGRGSFSWRSAKAAMGEGFPPDSISSDLHRYSVDGPGVDIPTMMGKFLLLGMSLRDVVASVTVGPAKTIGLPAPSLTPGQPADIAVFRVEDADITLLDASDTPEIGRLRLVPVLTVVGGRPIDPASVDIALRPLLGADRL
jgi:dihydroorotase